MMKRTRFELIADYWDIAGTPSGYFCKRHLPTSRDKRGDVLSLAQNLFRYWITDLQAKEAHLLKMPKTIASLALVFELVTGGHGDITIEEMNKALKWADYLESHARRLYASGNKIAEEAAKLIVARRGMISPIFTLRDIHQRGWENLTERDTVKAAIELLCQSHHIRETPSRTHQKGGRPSIRYEWNPMLNDKTSY